MSPSTLSPTEPLDVSVHDVSVIYHNGTVALQGANVRLQAGTITALIGMNGSGKSTLFKAIMGFLRPARGEVRIGGQPVAVAQRQSLVAYVPQSEEVDWTFPVSVWDVVLMGRYGRMNFLRRARQEDRRVAEESLRRVDLWAFRDRQIGELSGGQKKRAFLARALAQEGRVLLLDEPFTGVDARTEDTIIALLRELRAAGHLILVSTHDLSSIPEFCDQAVLINRRVLAAGPLAETFTPENLARAFGGAFHHGLSFPPVRPAAPAYFPEPLAEGA